MTQETLQERWVDVLEFPGYAVTDTGRIINKDTGRDMKITVNSNGVPMVGMMKSGKQAKRSVPLLVARAFLPTPEHELFDTPIHLDGDRTNNHHTNLAWRPLWFSRKYMRQFSDGHETYKYPVEDVDTGQVYENSMHAATVHGLLDVDIYFGMMNNVYVWPTHQTFRKAKQL